jgi:hypothetical protein
VRRLAAYVVVWAALVAAIGACRRASTEPATIEEAAALASTVRTSDPSHAVQLVNGFHAVEDGAWRWTKGKFSVNLQPPVSGAARGADLVMKFTVPEIVIRKNKDVTINASVNGAHLPPASFRTVGEHTLKLSVPASAVAGDAVRCDFVLDKTLPPTPEEQRELGVIVLSIGLQKKP